MQIIKSIPHNKKKKIYFVFLLIFSISFNQYYGNLGVCPIDSFWFFNSGYDALNGYYPFKDYWTIAGPFITFSQAVFFKILNVTWFSYVLHASLFNGLITISTFLIFNKLKLNLHYSFFYSLMVGILAYPSAGTPYVDHHASILSIIALFIFILAIKTNLKIYWFFLPIVLFVSFLTKQTPTGHIFIIISVLSIIYFLFNFNIYKIILGFVGSITIITLFFLILFFYEISFSSFFDQYILFPMSIGKMRFEYFLFPLEFSRIFLRYKLIHFPLLILMYISFKNIKYNLNYIKSNDFLVILSLIGTSYALIVHQLMTINGMYIFFIIPIMIGFSHIYFSEKYKNKKYFLVFLIVLSFLSTVNYGHKYINKRDFMDLKNANFENKISAEIFSEKLKGLKWISCLGIKNPKEEVVELTKAIKIIKKDKKNKAIITDYQFISVILNSYDYSPSQVWFINHVAYQKKNSKFYKKYKKFFIDKLKRNDLEIAYIIKPLWTGNDVFEKTLNEKCYTKRKITKILDSYTLLNCVDLKYSQD